MSLKKSKYSKENNNTLTSPAQPAKMQIGEHFLLDPDTLELEYDIEKRKINGLEIRIVLNQAIKKQKEQIKIVKFQLKDPAWNHKTSGMLEESLRMFKEGLFALETELRKYDLKIENEPISNDLLPTIIVSKENQKVMLLDELGVFDFLIEKHKLEDNHTRLAQIIESFTGIKQDTVRQTFRAISGQSGSEKNNPYKQIKNVEFVSNTLSALGVKSTKKSSSK